MDAPATFEVVIVVVGALGSVGVGFIWWFLNVMKSKANAPSVDRLWSELRVTQKEFNDHKIYVAQTYVTADQVREMEGRMLRHFDEKISDLKGAIGELKGVRP